MYKESRIRQSELFQLLLLDTLYAQSGSKSIVFQGGTALRWVYGGARFSEDLDFVTPFSRQVVRSVLDKVSSQLQNACIAQFGPGTAEQKIMSSRPSALKVFFIYSPQKPRERIAVKMEFERLAGKHQPQSDDFIFRELPQVSGLIATGRLFLPYTSSIIVSETPEEILSDKIRALFERKFIKGRDIYDVWWMTTQLGVKVSWPTVRRKLDMYQAPFVSARGADFFLGEPGLSELTDALKTDLPRFIPPNIFAVYQQENFRRMIEPLRQLTIQLSDQEDLRKKVRA